MTFRCDFVVLPGFLGCSAFHHVQKLLEFLRYIRPNESTPTFLFSIFIHFCLTLFIQLFAFDRMCRLRARFYILLVGMESGICRTALWVSTPRAGSDFSLLTHITIPEELTASANVTDNFEVWKYELLKKETAALASSSVLYPTNPIWRFIPLKNREPSYEHYFFLRILTSVTWPFWEKKAFNLSSVICLGRFLTNRRVLISL